MIAPARRIRPDDWSPVGVDELERNALIVVKSEENRSVIAGPGAGKTELLAQRATYLLQTGKTPPPQRILAISYKRDAATNLAARVRQRCHHAHAGRLDSMTFDAFAKSLVDRFSQVLPERWRPRPDYEILWTNDTLFRGFLTQALGDPPPLVGSKADILAITVKDFEREHLTGKPLPVDGWSLPTPAEWAADRFWQSSLHEGDKSHLSFPMIGRLAELILRLNPMARDALRLTYSHLFMDEFQDATQVQYDLVKTIFLGSKTVLTAVGDNKQQIMRWAMAMADPFGAFDKDFDAIRTPLYNNYRSSPELVRIQHILAQALDPACVQPVSKAKPTIDGDSCAIWDFSSPQMEAARLAEFVAAEIQGKGLAPRDFVLLVRQLADRYAAVLEPAFKAAGLSLRNEAKMVIPMVSLQELLPDEFSTLVVSMLRLASAPRAGQYWTECLDALASLHGLNPDDPIAEADLVRKLDKFAGALAKKYPIPPTDKPAVLDLIRAIAGFIGVDRLVASHPAYAQGNWLGKVAGAVVVHLQTSATGAADWTAALDAYEGVHAVPLMTIHKSKGLEYHTVIFVGLDDGAWSRSFNEDRIEATAAFFVAFTRAKQRVLFTYCAQRGSRETIRSFYELLKEAGVKTLAMG